MILTSKHISKKYNCEVFKDSGFDNDKRFWVAVENENDDEDFKFEYADGYTLQELAGNIEAEIKKRLI